GDGRLADVRVVILTTFELDEYVFEALRAGASGFLVKDTQPAELVRAVRVVASGEALLSPSVTRRLISEFADRAKPPPPAASMDVLTERERQLVGLVGEGLSNDDIAERLVLSPATVKTHVNRAMMKLGARDRAHLVVFAYESGLVLPGCASCAALYRDPASPDARAWPTTRTGSSTDDRGMSTTQTRTRAAVRAEPAV